MIPTITADMKITHSLGAAALTAAGDGASADLFGYKSALVIFNFGAWTDGTFTPTVYESADNSTFTAVGAADLLGTLTAVTGTADDECSQVAQYIGSKRYVKAYVTVAGSPATGIPCSATIIKQDPSCVRPGA